MGYMVRLEDGMGLMQNQNHCCTKVNTKCNIR